MQGNEEFDAIISNGTVVTPGAVFKGTVSVKNGRICDIKEGAACEGSGAGPDAGGNVADAEGLYVMPGLVDLHCDALEQTVQPRKGVFFPVSLAIPVVESQLLAAGITTIFHAISLSGEPGVRSNETAMEIIKGIEAYRKGGQSRMRHKIHARYELYNYSGLDAIEAVFREGLADLFSIMDHSDKYGEASSYEDLRKYVEKNTLLSGGRLDDYIAGLRDGMPDKKAAVVQKLIKLVSEYHIPFGTHDDYSTERINHYRKLGSSLCEFPLTAETARYAVEHGMYSIVGAPNILRNGSHTGNLSAGPAIKEGYADIICSDYYSGALLASVFLMHEEGMDLDRAVSHASSVPAAAAGIVGEAGGPLRMGGPADIILVSHDCGRFPAVKRAMVGGKWIYAA